MLRRLFIENPAAAVREARTAWAAFRNTGVDEIAELQRLQQQERERIVRVAEATAKLHALHADAAEKLVGDVRSTLGTLSDSETTALKRNIVEAKLAELEGRPPVVPESIVSDESDKK